jgi:hypothetical protein
VSMDQAYRGNLRGLGEAGSADRAARTPATRPGS